MSNSRPIVGPDWATDANYAGGPYPGNPNKQQPSSGAIAQGFTPGQYVPAEWVNFILNNHGIWIDYLDSLNGALYGDLFALYDDFTGSAVDDGLWIPQSSGNITLATDDTIAPPNNAMGVLQCDSPAGAGKTGLLTQQFNVGTADFHLTFRLRFPNYVFGGANHLSAFIGLLDGSNLPGSVYIQFSDFPTDTVTFGVPGMSAFSPSAAIPAATFDTWEIIRNGSTLSFILNGLSAPVYQTTTFTASLSQLFIAAYTLNGSNSHVGLMYLDLVRATIGRGVSSTADPTPPSISSEHVEEGNITVTGGSTATAAFTAPFAAAPPNPGGYKFRWDIAVTDGGPAPTIRVTDLGLDHMTFTIDSDNFNGVISWRAYV